MEPREIVQAAIDAYHAHDLDRCLGFYADDVVVKDARGTVMVNGAAEVRARYARSMAEHPDLHYDIPNRIALGDWVVDEERVTGRSDLPPGDVVRAVLVYTFGEGLIREIVIYA
ncbi:MAG: nuclear transport factor 2 family protein [Acidimicrobiales bacterium]